MGQIYVRVECHQTYHIVHIQLRKLKQFQCQYKLHELTWPSLNPYNSPTKVLPNPFFQEYHINGSHAGLPFVYKLYMYYVVMQMLVCKKLYNLTNLFGVYFFNNLVNSSVDQVLFLSLHTQT